jgi:hypothetical protein
MESPMSYLIQINDEQRLALIVALRQHPELTYILEECEGPLAYWVDMLVDLPNQPQTSIDFETQRHVPMINGFCL